MACESCGDKPKKCNKDFTKAVVEIDNPEQITLMRKVTIPASMGDDTTVPPVVGKYKNVLLYYEANQKSYLYSSDGIPTQLVNGVTDYEAAVNLPQINGYTLLGNKSADDLGLQDKLTAGENISINEHNVISAVDTTYGPATDTEIGLVKPGDGLSVDTDGTLDVNAGDGLSIDSDSKLNINVGDGLKLDNSNNVYAIKHVFDTVADMKASTDLVNGDYAQTLGFHTFNDGGGALYKITDTGTADEMYIIACDNLYANLVIKDYITPEVLGAYGDNIHDDTTAVQTCLSDTDYLHAVLSKDYKISTPLTAPDYKVVDGGGKIHSSSTCFELDGKNHLTIRDLKLYPQLHAIHIKSTTEHSSYNVFENIFCYGADTTDSKGLFLEVIGNYINEFTYRNCVFWNFKYGIYALNEANTYELQKHTFYDCSTEGSNTYGQYIKNGNIFSFFNCRHSESKSLYFVTEGVCKELLIFGGTAWFNTAGNQLFSSDTTGEIIGGLRYAGISNNAGCRNAYIIDGKVVPVKDAINTTRFNINDNITLTYPHELYIYYNFNTDTADHTLTLPSECYGGWGKINEFFVRTNKENYASTVSIGTFSKTLPAASGAHVYRFTLNTTGGGLNWFVEDITSAV